MQIVSAGGDTYKATGSYMDTHDLCCMQVVPLHGDARPHMSTAKDLCCMQIVTWRCKATPPIALLHAGSYMDMQGHTCPQLKTFAGSHMEMQGYTPHS
jgi:hypothetical protein